MRLAFLLLLLTIAPCWGAGAPVFLSGRVSDRSTRAPISGAAVALFLAKEQEPVSVVQTLQNGSFVFRLSAPGQYRLTVTRREYLNLDQPVKVPAAGLSSLDLPLAQREPLKVKVVGPDGKPVTTGQVQTWIWIWRGGAIRVDKPAVGPAPPDGVLTLVQPPWTAPGPPSGDVIGVRVPLTGCAELHSEQWPEGQVTLQLKQGRTLAGQVMNAQGRPAAHTPVDLLRILEDGSWSAVPTSPTNSIGRFEFPALFESKYILRVSIPGAGLRARVVTLSAPRTDITLTPQDSPWPLAELMKR